MFLMYSFFKGKNIVCVEKHTVSVGEMTFQSS